MSDIALTPAAHDWVRQHGGALTLRAMPQHGCCGGHAAVPAAEARVPEAVDDYDVLTCDGVTIYRARALAEGPYRVDLEGFWRWQRLTVEGGISRWRPAERSAESTTHMTDPNKGEPTC